MDKRKTALLEQVYCIKMRKCRLCKNLRSKPNLPTKVDRIREVDNFIN